MDKDSQISIRGAKEHNLKNISVNIPRNQLVVITGLQVPANHRWPLTRFMPRTTSLRRVCHLTPASS